MESVNCNLCNSSNAVPVYDLPDLLLERGEVRTVLLKCCQCGLIYQSPRPTLEEIGVHYPPEYESYNPEPDRKRTSWLLDKAIQYGIHKRSRFVTQSKTHGTLLDVGCSTGVFLRGMQRLAGWQLYGVEISKHAAQIARDQYGLDVYNGTLEQAGFPAEHFDAVTLWDVLEHLHDPQASLKEIYRILKPEGVLVLRVPNGGSWDAKLFGKYWAGLDAPRHLYVFNQETLEKMLAAAGFKLRQMSCGIGSYPTFVLSVRFWLLGRGASPNLRSLLARALYHPVSRLVTAPVFYLGNLGLRGPLLTVTVEKDIRERPQMLSKVSSGS